MYSSELMFFASCNTVSVTPTFKFLACALLICVYLTCQHLASLLLSLGMIKTDLSLTQASI